MKKTTKMISALCAFTLVFGMTGCFGNNNDPAEQDPPPAEESGFVARKKQEMPTAQIIDQDSDYGDESTWAAQTAKGIELGHVYLQDVIDDDVYDWGHSVIKVGDTYKMWWTRPAFYDAIFYAESKDLKNWVNVQRVICLSPNQSNIKKYDNIKGMLGKPSVVYVNGLYYMYFEAPATEDPDVTATVKEWDNQVMLATSTDGINWSFHADAGGEPQPVISLKDEEKNLPNKPYGVGQPSVFYKDNTFYLTYCYVMNGKHEIRVATSTDGVTFGDKESHNRIFSSNGLGVTYNTKTQKYMIIGGQLWESDTLDGFDLSSGQNYHNINTNEIQTAFMEFVRNEHGLVDTETFYVIHQYGVKSKDPNDWRTGHKTWDGYIHAVNPAQYGNRAFTLPNGAKDTTANRAQYRDRNNSYSLPTAEAIYVNDEDVKIDGERDAAYDGATKIEVVRPVYEYGSDLTDSWAETWVAWNEEYLYVFANVYDKTPNTKYNIASSALNVFMHDSFDVMVDTVNDHGSNREVLYGIEQYIISADSAGGSLVIKSPYDTDITSEFKATDRRYQRKITDFGYTVEMRVRWYEFALNDGAGTDYVKENAVIGMDFQVNDARGNLYGITNKEDIGREAMVVWANKAGESFRYLEGMGDVKLVKKA